MARSLKFYKGIDFRTYKKEDCPAIVFFSSDGSELELYPIERLAEDINEKEVNDFINWAKVWRDNCKEAIKVFWLI